MAEKKRIPHLKGSKPKPLDATQKTILELFPTRQGHDPGVRVDQQAEDQALEPDEPSRQPSPSSPSPTQIHSLSSKPDRTRLQNDKLYSIFEKPTLGQVTGKNVIEIGDPLPTQIQIPLSDNTEPRLQDDKLYPILGKPTLGKDTETNIIKIVDPLPAQTQTHLSSNTKTRLPNDKLYPIFEKPTPTDTLAPSNVIEIVDDRYVKVPPNSVPLTSETTSASTEGSSCHNPIILDGSPEKPTPQPEHSPTGVTSIFSIRGGRPQPPDPALPSRRRGVSTPAAPFPTPEFQHIRGQQSLFSSPASSFARKTSKVHTTGFSSPGSGSLNSLVSDHLECHGSSVSCCISRVAYTDRESYFNTIPEEDRSHPGLARLLECPPHTPNVLTPMSRKVWADKWRPTRANQILGNQHQALYLRDWLSALELQLESGPPAAPVNGKSKTVGKRTRKKRPRVLRAIDKKGRKKQRAGSDLDWIVNTSEEEDGSSEEDDQPYSLEDDDEWVGTVDHHRSPHERANLTYFDGILTNTILLTGPPGSGKTATVYACANELDWEVFEVYPGIGKRNSSSLENLIGDVGKNHLVRGTRQDRVFCGSSRPTVAETLTNTKTREAQSSPNDFGFVTAPKAVHTDSPGALTEAPPAVAGIRQSMVLLEEVDILYKEDANFWPAVVNIIKDCKRPVIMTCSDVDLIPKDDLPLQSILKFDTCPPLLAVSYLQSLCLAENYLVKRGDLFHLYQATYELNPLDISDARVSGPLPLPDLRRAINSLEFWSSVGDNALVQETLNSEIKSPVDAFEDMVDWGSLIGAQGDVPMEGQKRTGQLAMEHTELLSYADSHLTRNVHQTREALAMNDRPSVDDEVGHKMLFQPSNMAEFIFHHEDESIVEAVMLLSRGSFGARSPIIECTNTFPKCGLFRARVAHQGQLEKMLSGLIPRLVCHPSVYLDYEPWLRLMVGVDDALEEEGGRGRIRRTRSHPRPTYQRWIRLSDSQQELMRTTRLGIN